METQSSPIITMPCDIEAENYIRAYFQRFPKASYMDAVKYVTEQFPWALSLDSFHRELIAQATCRCSKDA